MITCLKWSERCKHEPLWAQWHRSSLLVLVLGATHDDYFVEIDGILQVMLEKSRRRCWFCFYNRWASYLSVELRSCTASTAAHTRTFRLDEIMIDNGLALSESRKVVTLVVVVVVGFVCFFKKHFLENTCFVFSKIRPDYFPLRICLSWSPMSFLFWLLA